MAKEDEVKTEDQGVTLTAEQFQKLMGRIDAQQAQLEKLKNPGVPEKVNRAKTHTRTLRLYEDKLVVKVGQVKQNYNLNSHDPNAMMLPITVRDLDGKEEEIKVPYRPFMEESPKVLCKLLKQDIITRDVTEITEGGGGVGQKTSQYDQKQGVYFNEVFTGELIEYTVTLQEVSEDIEVVQGEFKGTVLHFEHDSRNAINA